MNQAILDFFKANLTSAEIESKTVIELGSRNVNGSVRPGIEALKPASYTGVDIEQGQYVDKICDIQSIFTMFKPESFDVVVSTEMLEHIMDFRVAINAIKALTRTGGIVMLSTRSRGFDYHGYPHDFWRYEIEDMKALFSDFEIMRLESDGSSGVMLKARKQAMPAIDILDYQLFSIIYEKKMGCNLSLLQQFLRAVAPAATGPDYFHELGNLSAIGARTGTDKLAHGYLQKYEFFLKPLRDKTFNLLELGVFQGASILMWADYFRNAQIYGCDITPSAIRFSSERIHINILDLGNTASFPILGRRNYKVIIDDASHYFDHQLMAFFYLFPYLERGGIYILEDLHTSFGSMRGQFNHGSNDYTANVLLHLAELVLSQNSSPRDVNSYHNFLKSFAPQIDCITIIAKSCIIIKK